MRIALLGAGHWHAPMHADAVRFAGADLCAVWGTDPVPGQALAADFGAPFVADVAAALATKPDLCVVMGHPDDAPALARLVIDAGIPLILEKPAAPSTDILRALHKAAGDAFVAVPLANRLGPAMSGLPRDSAVAHASFRIINGPPRRYRDDGVGWVLDPHIGGGGALRNLGLHGIDCARSLARGPLRVVGSQVARLLHPAETVEDYALVTLTDDAGALFVVEAGYTTPSLAPGGDFEWRVATADGYLIDRGTTAQAIGPDGPRPLDPLPPGDRYPAFMVDTLARLADGRPPLVGLADYVAGMDLIDEAYRMAGWGQA